MDSTSGPREIREPLIWLGLTDPCATRERVILNDPQRDSALGVLSLWHEDFGDRSMLVAEVITEAEGELKQRLLAVAANRTDQESIDARRLGAWCGSIEDRIFGDFRLSRDGSVQRAVRWKVSSVSSVSSKPAGQNGTTHTQNDPLAENVRVSPSFYRQETNSPDSPDSLREITEDDEGVDL